MENEYDRRAREADQLAQTAKSEDERRAHDEVAAMWRQLAERKRAKEAKPD